MYTQRADKVYNEQKIHMLNVLVNGSLPKLKHYPENVEFTSVYSYSRFFSKRDRLNSRSKGLAYTISAVWRDRG